MKKTAIIPARIREHFFFNRLDILFPPCLRVDKTLF
jgi:hypothetical protein